MLVKQASSCEESQDAPVMTQGFRYDSQRDASLLLLNAQVKASVIAEYQVYIK